MAETSSVINLPTITRRVDNAWALCNGNCPRFISCASGAIKVTRKMYFIGRVGLDGLIDGWTIHMVSVKKPLIEIYDQRSLIHVA